MAEEPKVPEVPAAPDVQRPPNSYKLRPKQRAMLEAYAICGNLTKAAELAGISRLTHYDWLEREPGYGTAFEAAETRFADQIREFVRQRALVGVPEPIIWQGEIMRDKDTQEIITVLKRSDRILELLAKSRCPEFRDKTEITGAGGAPLQLQVITGVPQPTVDSED
jgi:hypothetical protein